MREDLIERLRERAEFEDKRVLDEAKALGFVPEVYSGSQTGALLREAAAALEAAREDGKRMKRDIAELYDVIPMLPITGETMDAATDWFTRYCIDFHREINTAIDQARGKAGGEVEGG